MGDAITVRDLTVARGGQTVLDNQHCGIPAGRITGLLGPSGAGKTTLIRAVVGVQRIQSGTITVLGRPAGAPELRASVGYLTQAPSVYLDLTVLESARYVASICASTDAAHAAVDQVGLEAVQHQLVGTLPGGQRSRASLACAVVGDPAVLVLDEPTVGQDPVLREELWDQAFLTLIRQGAASSTPTCWAPRSPASCSNYGTTPAPSACGSLFRWR